MSNQNNTTKPKKKPAPAKRRTESPFEYAERLRKLGVKHDKMIDALCIPEPSLKERWTTPGVYFDGCVFTLTVTNNHPGLGFRAGDELLCDTRVAPVKGEACVYVDANADLWIRRYSSPLVHDAEAGELMSYGMITYLLHRVYQPYGVLSAEVLTETEAAR